MTLWLSEEATLRVSESADVGPRKNIVYTPEGTCFVIIAAALTLILMPRVVSLVVSCRWSCRVVSCRVVSCRVVSCRWSCRVVSCRVVSCRVVSCRVVGRVFTKGTRRIAFLRVKFSVYAVLPQNAATLPPPPGTRRPTQQCLVGDSH
jgi:hypothetical protein